MGKTSTINLADMMVYNVGMLNEKFRSTRQPVYSKKSNVSKDLIKADTSLKKDKFTE